MDRLERPASPQILPAKSRRRLHAGWGVCITVVLVLTVAGRIAAQRALEAEAAADRLPLQPQSEREQARGIHRAEERLRAGEFTQALRFLDEVLARDADTFLDEGSADELVGLKQRAAELLAALPEAGREAYLAAYNPAAERALKAAVTEGSSAALAAVARRYFACPAGQDAALLLAQAELDRGLPAAAGLTYDRMLAQREIRARLDPQLSLLAAAAWRDAGDEKRAGAILQGLKVGPKSAVAVAGRPEPLAAANLESWLAGHVPAGRQKTGGSEDWLTWGGNAARNSESRGGLPHMRLRWQVRTLPHPELEDAYEEVSSAIVDSGTGLEPAYAPLAVGDTIILRTATTLYGVDFKTGKLLWQSEPQRAYDIERLLPRESDDPANEAIGAASREEFKTRIWRNRLAAEMSSDGRRAYVLRYENTPAEDASDVWAGGPFGPAATGRAPTNRLCAYDLANRGAKAWEIDGADVEGELPGAFFTGAPVVVGDQLWVAVEQSDSVSLAALDAATGKVIFRQPLASLDFQLTFDQERRLAARACSFAEGILVCPTDGGIVFGFDVDNRRFAWAYRYPRKSALGVYPTHTDQRWTNDGTNGWFSQAPVVVDGKALVAPTDADEIHCLDLRTGKVLWRHERAGMTAIACVSGDLVLLTSSQKAMALHLADGTPAWRGGWLAWPEGGVPTGRGYLAAGKYFVPLSTGEVAAVDVAAGEIAGKSAGRPGQTLGNLVCHNGAVLSQTGRFLERFDLLDVVRDDATAALAKNSTDADALRTLGEIAMNEGRRSEAVDLLERAHRAAPDDLDVAAVLTECLIDALDTDFVAYRARLPLLDELQDGSVDRRLALLRIRARGLAETGQSREAAQACLDLYDLVGDAETPFELSTDYAVMPAHWGRAQLDAILERASPDDRKWIVDRCSSLNPREDAAEADLVHYLQWFGDLPAGDSIRVRLAAANLEAREFLAAQQLDLTMAESADDAMRGAAVARIASGLRAAGKETLAAPFDRRLATEFADVVCLDGKTGRDLAKPGGTAGLDWPQGRVHAELKTTVEGARGGPVRTPQWGVPLERADEILGTATIVLDSRTGALVVRDGWGREVFSSAVDANSPYAAYRTPGMSYAVARGSLLVLSTGRQVVAVNSLERPGGRREQIVLWSADVLGRESHDPLPGSASDPPRRAGSYRPPRAEFDHRWAGVIGPVTQHGVVYHDSRRLISADPLSGAIQWRRDDVPAGCDLFGDEQFVFVTPPKSEKAMVYSAVDGRALGERSVPKWSDRLTTRGHIVVAWQSVAEGRRLAAIDAWTGETVWSYSFSGAAQVDVDAGNVAAVVDPAGAIAVVDLATGKLIADDRDQTPEMLDSLHLLAGTDAVVMVCSRDPSRAPRRVIDTFNQFDFPKINGEVYVYDRATGRMRWNQPAQVAQQALMLTQGVDLPVIVFASSLTMVDRTGSGPKMSLLVLDKGTGRTLYRSDEVAPVAANYCVPRVAEGDHEHVLVEMSRHTLDLRFTDEPRPPAPPSMAAVEADQTNSEGGLGKLFLKVLEGAEAKP